MNIHLKKSIESTNLRLDHCWEPRIQQTKCGMAAFLSVLKLLSQVFTMFCGFTSFLLSLKIAQLIDSHKSVSANGFYFIESLACAGGQVTHKKVFESFAIMSQILQCAVTERATMAQELFINVDLTCSYWQ